MDGDGDRDVIAASPEPASFVALLNDGMGGLVAGPVHSESVPTRIQWLASGDIDGDGDADLVLGGDSMPSTTVAIWDNNGLGQFTRRDALMLDGFSKTLGRLRDVDGDGDDDLVVRAGQDDSGKVLLILRNFGDGTFGETCRYANLNGRFHEVADINGDGVNDVIKVDAYLATSFGWFEPPFSADCDRDRVPDECDADLSPAVVVSPNALAAPLLDEALLQGVVAGQAPYTYQWRRDGVALADSTRISGTRTPTLTISGVQLDDAGTYDLVVTDTCGTGVSNPATLIVVDPCAGVRLPLLFVASAGAGSVWAFDGATSAVLRTLAYPGSNLDDLRGLALNGQSRLFIGSGGTHEVVELDLVTVARVRVFGGGGLTTPTGLLLRPGQLLVSSFGTDSVMAFDLAAGTYAGDFVAPGAGGLAGPQGLRRALNGNLLVCGEGAHSVLEYDWQTGAFVRVAAAGGGLTRPMDVLPDIDGTLLVSSFDGDRVLRFAANGGPLGEFVAAGAGGLDGAAGLAWSAAGHVLVASRNSNQVLEFDRATGTLVRVAAAGALAAPTFIATVPACDADCNANRMPDRWDTDLGTSADCDANHVPDECQGPLGPQVLVPPQNLTRNVGEAAEFAVTATGVGELGYQWRRNGVDLADGPAISGATTAVLTLDPVGLPSAGSYDVVVTTACGTVTSAPATLTVLGIVGDLNCDGDVNFDDIDPFVLALQSASQYAAAYPDCERALADCNGDSVIDFDDIDAFVALLGARG